MSFWDKALSVGRSVATTAFAVTPVGAVVALSRSSRTASIVIGEGTTGVVGGVASLFGDRAQNWAERHTRNGMSHVTGVNLNQLSGAEKSLAETSNDVGNVAGIGATFLIPGGAAVRSVSLGLKGASMISRVARLPQIAESATLLSTNVMRLNHMTFTGGLLARGGKWGAFEGAHFVADDLILPAATGLAVDTARSIFNAVAGSSPAHAATPNASGTDITTSSNALITSTQNVTATFSKAAEDGVVSNADIAALKENAAALKGAKLSDADRAAFAKEASTIIRDFEKNPPAWTDPRTYRLQVLLGIDADSICGKDTNDMIKQFKLDHKTLFTQPAPVMAPH